MQTSPLYGGQLCGLCGSMDGNKWNEHTTIDHKTFSTPERFVNSFATDSLKSLDDAIVRESNVAVQQRFLNASERQWVRSNVKTASSLEADERRPIISSGYEEQDVLLQRPDASAEGPASDRVCRVGYRVNRVVSGNTICVSTSAVPRCSSDVSACRESARVSRRHVTTSHICVPKDSSSLRSAAAAISDTSADLDKVISLPEQRLQYVLKIFERSPRSEYREFGVDMC